MQALDTHLIICHNHPGGDPTPSPEEQEHILEPKNPEQPPQSEVQPFPFFLSSRFDSREASQAPYNTIQAIIHEKAVELSAFRLLQNWPESMSKASPGNKRWYVAALGFPPPEPFLTQVREAIQMGEPAQIPDEAIVELARRRLKETAKRQYTEIHRTLTMRRKQDKEKRKQHKQSRRRNRGQ